MEEKWGIVVKGEESPREVKEALDKDKSGDKSEDKAGDKPDEKSGAKSTNESERSSPNPKRIDWVPSDT